MATPKIEKYSGTGRQIYRVILRKGWDLRRFARAMEWAPDRQDRVTRFLQRNHTTPELLSVAELLGCSAADLLPPELFEPPSQRMTDEVAR